MQRCLVKLKNDGDFRYLLADAAAEAVSYFCPLKMSFLLYIFNLGLRRINFDMYCCFLVPMKPFAHPSIAGIAPFRLSSHVVVKIKQLILCFELVDWRVLQFQYGHPDILCLPLVAAHTPGQGQDVVVPLYCPPHPTRLDQFQDYVIRSLPQHRYWFVIM